MYGGSLFTPIYASVPLLSMQHVIARFTWGCFCKIFASTYSHVALSSHDASSTAMHIYTPFVVSTTRSEVVTHE